MEKEMKIKEEKQLVDYDITHPKQLSFWFNKDGSQIKFSNTVEIYDILPKYSYGNQIREKTETGEYLSVLTKEFKHKVNDLATNFKVDIIPARLVEKGESIDYYPSRREHLVEDVLKKFACEGRGIYLDSEAGLTFSLYEVEQELKKHGHGYNIRNIKKEILISRMCNIKLTSNCSEYEINNGIYLTAVLPKKGSTKKRRLYKV
jgi:hypothetical protein